MGAPGSVLKCWTLLTWTHAEGDGGSTHTHAWVEDAAVVVCVGGVGVGGKGWARGRKLHKEHLSVQYWQINHDTTEWGKNERGEGCARVRLRMWFVCVRWGALAVEAGL
jgi:hypothetical protein